MLTEKPIESRQMICDWCRKAVPISDVRYVPKGNDSRTALCTICRAKHENTGLQPVKKSDPNKKNYFCGRCRYKFRFDSAVSRIKCPYCGEADKLTELKPAPAETLVKTKFNEKELW